MNITITPFFFDFNLTNGCGCACEKYDDIIGTSLVRFDEDGQVETIQEADFFNGFLYCDFIQSRCAETPNQLLFQTEIQIDSINSKNHILSYEFIAQLEDPDLFFDTYGSKPDGFFSISLEKNKEKMKEAIQYALNELHHNYYDEFNGIYNTLETTQIRIVEKILIHHLDPLLNQFGLGFKKLVSLSQN